MVRSHISSGHRSLCLETEPGFVARRWRFGHGHQLDSAPPLTHRATTTTRIETPSSQRHTAASWQCERSPADALLTRGLAVPAEIKRPACGGCPAWGRGGGGGGSGGQCGPGLLRGWRRRPGPGGKGPTVDASGEWALADCQACTGPDCDHQSATAGRADCAGAHAARSQLAAGKRPVYLL